MEARELDRETLQVSEVVGRYGIQKEGKIRILALKGSLFY